MQPFTTLIGPAAPLLRGNIDTDVIIRIERMTALPASELGPWALEALRYRPDGTEDPDFILNKAPFREAPILLAGPNFGCGSSREPAVTALMGRGIRCVIAPGFGDIFLNNCYQNGLLPIVLEQREVEALAVQCDSGALLTVDLRSQQVSAPDGAVHVFEIAPMKREALLLGLDDIGLTLQEDAEIRQWQRMDRHRRPWAWLVHKSAESAAD